MFQAEGEFNAIFCNEMSRVLVPDIPLPLATSQGSSSLMGLHDYPDFEELLANVFLASDGCPKARIPRPTGCASVPSVLRSH